MSQSMKALDAMLKEGITLTEAVERYGITKSTSLRGFQIVESKFITPIPKLQLSSGFDECSAEMKASMNKYLLDMFGTYTPAYVIGSQVFVSPKHAAMLRLQS